VIISPELYRILRLSTRIASCDRRGTIAAMTAFESSELDESRMLP
jgi:hypothetical protein